MSLSPLSINCCSSKEVPGTTVALAFTIIILYLLLTTGYVVFTLIKFTFSDLLWFLLFYSKMAIWVEIVYVLWTVCRKYLKSSIVCRKYIKSSIVCRDIKKVGNHCIRTTDHHTIIYNITAVFTNYPKVRACNTVTSNKP